MVISKRKLVIMIQIGLRVVRGPGWRWDDQDGGEGCAGTVVEIKGVKMPEKTVIVQWDCGKRSNYCAGRQGLYDLYILDSAPADVKHSTKQCDYCVENVIRGTRWQCAQCIDYDLCTPCYMNGKHKKNHKFYRYDSDTSSRQMVPPRSDSNTIIQSCGLYPNARVVRGYDWEPRWRDQDGGKDQPGTITELRGKSSNSSCNVAAVKWDNGTENIYRVGCSGKVDLKCIVPGKGMLYYRDHLAICGKVNTPCVDTDPSTSSGLDCSFKLGDKVQVSSDVYTLRQLLDGHGGWNPKMDNLAGECGVVHRITTGGDVRVQFEPSHRDEVGGKESARWTFPPAALSHVSDFSNEEFSFESSSSNFSNVHQPPCFKDVQFERDQQLSRGDGINSSKIAPGLPVSFLDFIKYAATGDLNAIQLMSADNLICYLNKMQNGTSAMHQAVTNGNCEVMHYLYHKGMSVELSDQHDNRALHCAILGLHADILTTLIKECDANIDATGEFGFTPLHLAVKQSFVDGVKILVQHGCSVTAQDELGNTALHLNIIASDCNQYILKLLCEHASSDFNLCNQKGLNVFHQAAMTGVCSAIEMLLRKNISIINCTTKPKKSTALHLAVRHGHLDVVQHLIEKKCDIDAEDDEGCTALHIALRKRLHPTFNNLYKIKSTSDPWVQVLEFISKHNLSSGIDACNWVLAVVCFLAIHGARVDDIQTTNIRWIACIQECSSYYERHHQACNAGSSSHDVRSYENQIASLEKKLVELEQDHTCCICFEENRNTVFDSCGHGTCRKCASELVECPICRSVIKKIIKMY